MMGVCLYVIIVGIACNLVGRCCVNLCNHLDAGVATFYGNLV